MGGSLAGRLAGAGVDCQAVTTEAAVGGGGGPGVTLPSAALSLLSAAPCLARAWPTTARATSAARAASSHQPRTCGWMAAVTAATCSARFR